jgi:hypothetical protein
LKIIAVLYAIFIGALCGALTLFELELNYDLSLSSNLRIAISLGIFAVYLIIVVSGTSGKKRSLSVAWQTILGVMTGLVIASIFELGIDGYGAAALIGFVLGFTADYWTKYLSKLDGI